MKVRARFTKVGRVRWTSHRDVARMWERALRRGRVPVAYTAGFSPRPQLSFGLALPTGCESVAEYLDISLATPVDPVDLGALVGPLLPDGVDVVAAGVLEHGAPSLQEMVSSCTWEIEVPGDPDDLGAAIERVLGAASLPIRRERKGRAVVDDLRPSVLALSSAGAGATGALLLAELGTRPRGVRPAELAQAMGIELGLARRTRQLIERDGSRGEPLVADHTGAAFTWERAS
ncbi:MAG TPA: TIGR03936 family radical SAM-associated protein [Acidimicrobiales bacterium]|nr:TIGR03936 family radical SAM-associated protein [Acidimicrobiales bacterium]